MSKVSGLADFAFDFHGPGARGQAAGVLRGVALFHAELVEVVVVGDVVVAGQLLAGGGERLVHGLQFGSGVDGARRKEFGKPLGCRGPQRRSRPRPSESGGAKIAIVVVAGRDFGRWNIGWFADEHG